MMRSNSSANTFAGFHNAVTSLAAMGVLLLMTAFQSQAQASSAVQTVGDPANPTALQASLQSAYDSGARRLKIRPGIYQMPSSDHDVVKLSGWQNATVSAYGVIIVTDRQKWPSAQFDLDRCTGVTIAGPLLTQVEQTVYQGKVVATGTTDGRPATFYCDWVPDVGYPAFPVDLVKFPSVNVIDAHTRLLKFGLGDFYNAIWTSVGGGKFRITNLGKTIPNIAVGDWLVARRDIPIAIKVHLDNCNNCTVKDVTMTRNGFAPIFETGGSGNHILSCKWMLGPKPVGAIEAPLVTNQADGFHSSGTVVGPDIENCVMEGVFLDDNIAIHGSFCDVVSGSGNSFVVKSKGAAFKIGEPARLCDGSGYLAEATVTDLSVGSDDTIKVTTDKPVNATTGAKAYNPLACGAGYKIINCKFGYTRSRGILVKGDDGLIQGNTIVACGMSAISIGPEFYWNEAGYAENVEVIDNKIDGCGVAGYGGAAILVHGDGAMGNRNIDIVGNKLMNSYQGDMEIDWANTVKIDGNTMTGATGQQLDQKHPAITISNSQNVQLNGNSLSDQSAYRQPLVDAGAGAGVVGAGPEGLRVR